MNVFTGLISLYVLDWGIIDEGKDVIWDCMAVTGAICFSGEFAVLMGGPYGQ